MGGLLPAKLVLDNRPWKMARGSRSPANSRGRAFLNGRLDLAQARGRGRSHPFAPPNSPSRPPTNQLAGKLSQRINQLRDEMMKTLAHVEAHIDFPDEDIAPENPAPN